MQVHKINNVNFNGIYKIRKEKLQEGFDNVDHVINSIRQKYAELMQDDIISMSGETPFTEGVIWEINEAAEKTGYSDYWIRENARRHGLNLSRINDDYITFITTRKDFQDVLEIANGKRAKYDGDLKKLEKYSKKLYFPKTTLKDIIYGLKFPSYLVNIAIKVSSFYRLNQKFEEIFKHKIHEPETRDELVKLMFEEQ